MTIFLLVLFAVFAAIIIYAAIGTGKDWNDDDK